MAVTTFGQLQNWAMANDQAQNLHLINEGKQVMYNNGTVIYTAWIDSNQNLCPVDLATYAELQTMTP
jgi:hypothetical protein